MATSRKSEIKFFAAFWTFMIFTFALALHAFGQTAVAVSSDPSQALVKAQGIVDQLGTGWTITIAGFIIEILLRAFKTQNPKSLLYVVSNVLNMLAKVCTFLAQSADAVLQRTKDDPAKADENKAA